MKRSRYIFLFIVVLIQCLLAGGVAEAITLNVSPKPAVTGQTVTATVTASYPGSPPCGSRAQIL